MFDRSLVSMSQNVKLFVQDRKLLRVAFEREAEKLASESAIAHHSAQNQVIREREVFNELDK